MAGIEPAFSLDELLTGLPAISLEGTKGVGKTARDQRRAATTLALNDVNQVELLVADPARLDTSPTSVVVDEWQRHSDLRADPLRRGPDRPTTDAPDVSGRALRRAAHREPAVPAHRHRPRRRRIRSSA